MNTSILEILSSAGELVQEQITANISATGQRATGKTEQSIRYEAVKVSEKAYRLTILGRPYFYSLETGRRPTPDKKPSREMVENISDWMEAKGIDGGKKRAWAIATKIQKFGTKLYRDGGRNDVISNVVNTELIENVSLKLLDFMAEDTLRVVKKFFEDQNKQPLKA